MEILLLRGISILSPNTERKRVIVSCTRDRKINVYCKISQYDRCSMSRNYSIFFCLLLWETRAITACNKINSRLTCKDSCETYTIYFFLGLMVTV